MDVINGIGTVLIIALCIVLAPLFWLAGHPLALFLLLGLCVLALFLIRSTTKSREYAARSAYERAIAKDPFKSATDDDIRFWNTVRSNMADETEWVNTRRSIANDYMKGIEYDERKRDSWKGNRRMCDSYQRDADEGRRKLAMWQDGGLFDKPLSWGEYKYED